MKICLVHNEYARVSGEEVVVGNLARLLAEKGHELVYFTRSSATIKETRFGLLRAFGSGIYSFSSRRALGEFLGRHRPDVVHVHNLYPLISPSVLGECRRHGVPVVMTVHNYRLICPNGMFVSHGETCERCAGGREYWCVLRNCEGTLAKSLGYALRNYLTRLFRFYLDNVAAYGALTEFQRQKLIKEGFPAEKIVVIPNMAEGHKERKRDDLGEYVGFIGRISPEKDVTTLLAAARRCPEVPFKAAGSLERMPDLAAASPPNFRFLGHLASEEVTKFYAGCRLVVLCSRCYEGFPLVLVEAMLWGRPIICSRIGGLPEIVEDGVSGLLFSPGDAGDLAEKIRCLWENPELCAIMGNAGKKKALREYSADLYYERTLELYQRALGKWARS